MLGGRWGCAGYEDRDVVVACFVVIVDAAVEEGVVAYGTKAESAEGCFRCRVRCGRLVGFG